MTIRPLGSPKDAVQRPARPRRRRSRAGREAVGSFMAFNLAPMIDVVFNLLIYFIVGTTFLRVEGMLPSRMARLGSGADARAIPVTPIRLILSRVPDDQQRVRIRLENSAVMPRDFADLSRVLKDLRTGGIGFDALTPIIIHPEDEVAWDHVVNAFNAAKRAGYEAVNFGTARRTE